MTPSPGSAEDHRMVTGDDRNMRQGPGVQEQLPVGPGDDHDRDYSPWPNVAYRCRGIINHAMSD
jgi:hypothetical protein